MFQNQWKKNRQVNKKEINVQKKSQFTEEETWMANKHVTKPSISLTKEKCKLNL